MNTIIQKNKSKIFSILTILSYLLLAEILLYFKVFNSKFIPFPSDILIELWSNYQEYLIESLSTITTILSGLIPAIVIGGVLAFFTHESKVLNFLLRPLISLSQLVPKTALIPFFLAIPFLGYSFKSKVLITFLISFFPVYSDVLLGLTLIKPDYLLFFKSLNASHFKEIIYLKIPFSLPYFFSGIKMAILYSVIGAVTSEILIGNSGLGYIIDYSSQKFNFNRSFAGIFLCAILGLLLLSIPYVVEKFLGNYHDDREN